MLHAGIRLTLFFISGSVLLLSGCATPALWQAAEGLGDAELKLEVIDIKHASKVSTDEIEICLRVFELETKTEKDMTLSIPLRDRSRWKFLAVQSAGSDSARNIPSPTGMTRNYIEFRPLPSHFKPHCHEHGARLPILLRILNTDAIGANGAPVDSAAAWPLGTTDAVYKINAKGFPIHIGYSSSEAIHESNYSIDVPADYFRSVRTQETAKPYLYLLTPFAMIADAAMAILVIGGSGQGSTVYHPTGSTSGSK